MALTPPNCELSDPFLAVPSSGLRDAQEQEAKARHALEEAATPAAQETLSHGVTADRGGLCSVPCHCHAQVAPSLKTEPRTCPVTAGFSGPDLGRDALEDGLDVWPVERSSGSPQGLALYGSGYGRDEAEASAKPLSPAHLAACPLSVLRAGAADLL